jgi:hypothetical protein
VGISLDETPARFTIAQDPSGGAALALLEGAAPAATGARVAAASGPPAA